MSRTLAWPFPGVVWGDYPEQEARPGARRQRRPLGRGALARFADAAADRPLAPADLPAQLRRLRQLPAREDAWMLAAVRVAACALTQTLGYPPHRQQLLAARVLLDDRLVEMATGEGKTAAIALAAAVGALGRAPVHVVTANDYLAQRDAQALRPFFALLGLRVDCVTQPMAAPERRAAYAADVTYCTAKELVFDWLRDGLQRAGALSPLEQRARRLALAGRPPAAPVLRGLCMAILDEADTVLIDEARVPFVLAQQEGGDQEEAFHRGALEVARRLAAGTDFLPAGDGRRFALTPQGRQRLAAWPPSDQPLLAHRAHREAAVEQALVALHVLQRDRDYVVRDGRVQLVDATTGRAAAGRAWSAGLHQLVERKEGIEATRRNATLAQVSFQRFFPRYLRLAGASGTLREARAELRTVYGLDLVVVPPRTPARVTRGPTEVHADSERLWQVVAREARDVSAGGRAVLVGTETVAQSEALSRVLAGLGVAHRVLNARQDSQESELIAAAGRPGQVTVATSMAGRGTDIACTPEVLEQGGLHVILCQLNASARIDRQFAGRAGRQGQPGSVRRVLALDFDLVRKAWPEGWLRWLAGRGPASRLAKITVWAAQRRESFTHAYERVRLCRVTELSERNLNFSRQVLP